MTHSSMARWTRAVRVAFLFLLPLLVAIGGCERKPASAPAASAPADTAAPARTTQLTVFAAASLADAFREIGASFEAAHPGARVAFSFGGSNQLRTQLENGAPADLFASADRRQMDAAVASQVVDETTVRVFAHNRLALIVPRENRAGVKELADLARPGLKVVVADKAVPVGNYTRLMLDKARELPSLGPAFVDAFDANTVSREENVAAVVAKIALNEADAAIAYASDAAGSNGPKLTSLPLPPGLEQRADYVVGVTARAADPALAAKFLEFLLSEEAAAKLVARGFTTPERASP